jgi:hypothetical protein
MPTFDVRHTFEIPDRQVFVLAGSVVEGVIQPGMFLRVPFKPTHSLNLLVDSIETARRDGDEDVCLCIHAGANFMKILRILELRDQSFKVEDFSEK